MDEIELIQLAKLGDKSAINSLFQNNLSVLKGYVVKMVGEQELAKDIIQDTLLKAVLHIQTFEPRAKFSTWLITIATNVYRDHLRKQPKTEPLTETIPDRKKQVDEQVMLSVAYQEIIQIIMKLPYEKRAVFILKHFQGFTYEEIAKILKCPIGTVRSRLHHAIGYIIQEIERKEILS